MFSLKMHSDVHDGFIGPSSSVRSRQCRILLFSLTFAYQADIMKLLIPLVCQSNSASLLS
jgi:hypothetical protein